MNLFPILFYTERFTWFIKSKRSRTVPWRHYNHSMARMYTNLSVPQISDPRSRDYCRKEDSLKPTLSVIYTSFLKNNYSSSLYERAKKKSLKKEYYSKSNKTLPLYLYPPVGYYFWIKYTDRGSDRSHTIYSTYKHYPVEENSKM